MRRLNIFLALAFFFTSCVVDDVQYVENGPIDIDGGIKIFGTVQDFDIKKVTTRASEGELPSDSFISEMTMFVFGSDGNLIQGYSSRIVHVVDKDGLPTSVTFNDADKCSSAVNINKANPTFLIDTKEGLIASLDDAYPRIIYYDNLNGTNLDKCTIYIVANAWHKLSGVLDSITTLSALENIVLDINEKDAMSMPKKDDGHYRGFPMIGTHKGYGTDKERVDYFDLSKNGNNAGAVAKIPLKKLYSKIDFTIQVNANQVVSTPKFKIEKAEVFNVPKKARLGRELDGNSKPYYSSDSSDDYIVEMVGNDSYTTADYYHYTETPFEVTNFSRREIQHTESKALSTGSEYLIEFSFYMPEHKVTPNTITYPFDTTKEENHPYMQYYKPKGVGAVRNGDGTTSAAKTATFVRIHGVYTDHNGQIKTVRYDIYLGQDNTDDFTVKRNQLLTNRLVITGLTNYHDAYGDGQTNISVDHRVDVDYKGFNLSMEREAILDAHFEVRPLDVELSPNSTMEITIPEDCRDWVAMESDAAARDAYSSGKYVSNGDRKAVRKYFTTDLVSELNKNNGYTMTINHSGTVQGSEIHRIWFYIDENPNVYDKLWKNKEVNYAGITGDSFKTTDGLTTSTADNAFTVSKTTYRNCPVAFTYVGTDNDNTDGAATVKKTATINFQQWNLWRVWSADKTRFYDIEHEEEYLNNYASDAQYGGTQNGMPFGLEGIQLSDGVSAYWQERHTYSINIPFIGDILSLVINALDRWLEISSTAKSVFAQSKQKPYYDFYLTRDAFPVDKLESTVDKTQYARDYQGLQFNKEIAATLKANIDPKAKIDGIILTEDPKSAFAYCYHKNKRNSDGTIDIANIKWFLPAIDEIEDIALGAYDEFDQVFQNKKYWSCQPAYNYNTLRINPDGKTLGQTNSDYVWFEGEFYSDNTLRARSTSVYATSATTYTTIDSGLPNGVVSGHLLATAYQNGNVSISYSGKEINYNTDIYTTGNYRGNSARNDIARIRAVYRSGTK